MKISFFQKSNFGLWFWPFLNFPAKNRTANYLKTAHFKVSQVQIDGFSTILDEQNFTFRQIRQAEISILEKIAYNFGGKIQMRLKSVF